MHVALPKLAVTGGCPLQRAAMGDWLLAHGFGIADSAPPANAEVELFLCSEHDPAAELMALAPLSRTIAVLSCTCERALGIARSRCLPNVFCADEAPERLAVAIRSVLAGQNYHSPSFKQFLERPSAPAAGCSLILTPRELDVLRLLAQGFSKKRIAETLHLSVKTIDNHSTSIMSKLNIHNRVDLARYAIREGLATA
ncbi:MAG: response regulator transcription factor [Phycisphaerales bacterium]